MSTAPKMRLTFIAKLRHVGNYRPNEQMIIRNLEAHREQCEYMMQLKASPNPGAPAVSPAAEQLLQNELKDYLAGQQLVVPMSTGCNGFGFSDIGGVM